MPAFRQFQIEPAEDRQRGCHRHEIVERRIGIGVLESGHLRVAIAAVGGDDHPRAGIGDTVGQGLVGEAAEHRSVNHAHPLGRFGPVDLRDDARHVQCHAVARLQAQRFKRHGALRHLQQQLLAADGEAIDRRALAAVGGHVPAVALKDQRGFIAVAGQHVAIKFREGGIGAAAHKPAPVRRGGTIETGVPRGEIPRQIRGDRRAGRRIPAVPAAIRALGEPCAVRAAIGHEPMHVARGNRAVECAGICQRGGAHRLPIGARAHGIDHGNRPGSACTGFGHYRFPQMSAHRPRRSPCAGPYAKKFRHKQPSDNILLPRPCVAVTRKRAGRSSHRVGNGAKSATATGA